MSVADSAQQTTKRSNGSPRSSEYSDAVETLEAISTSGSQLSVFETPPSPSSSTSNPVGGSGAGSCHVQSPDGVVEGLNSRQQSAVNFTSGPESDCRPTSNGHSFDTDFDASANGGISDPGSDESTKIVLKCDTRSFNDALSSIANASPSGPQYDDIALSQSSDAIPGECNILSNSSPSSSRSVSSYAANGSRAASPRDRSDSVRIRFCKTAETSLDSDNEREALSISLPASFNMKHSASAPHGLRSDGQTSMQNGHGSSAGPEPVTTGSVCIEADVVPDSVPSGSEPGQSPQKLGKQKPGSDRKRKGTSWYSVLSPTYKSRSEDFKRIFKDVPSTERMIVDYSCALQKDILVHGRLYISREFVCFYANIFRWETVLTIRCKDIVKVSKERTARVIPNAIQLCTKDDKYFFTSFGTRDKTFMILERVWKLGIADQEMKLQELWQWVHYSYGEDLGLTSDDDADYVPLSAEDKIQFQVRIQREEKQLAQQQTGDTGSILLDSSANKEPTEDYSLTSCDLHRLTIPSSFIDGVGNEADRDSLLADNGSVASGDDPWLATLDLPLDDGLTSKRVLKPMPAVGVAGDDSNILTDEEDSTEDEEVDRPCSGHAHYNINVVDEMLNIPIDTVFEHCFTDSPLYRDFVRNKKMFAEPEPCSGHEHFSRAIMLEVFPISVDEMFLAIFSDSDVQRAFCARRKTQDVILSPWPEEPDSTGVKVRNIAYTLSLNYSIGPKCSPSTERQIMYPDSRPGQFYLVDTECINGGIPYGDNFYVVNRYCIVRISNNKCRLRITSQIKYRKSVWGIVKSFIEKNAAAGIIESFNVLAELLRQESNRQAQLALCAQSSSLARKRVLRRRRVSERVLVSKRPSVADTPYAGTSKQATPIKHAPAKAPPEKDEWHVKLTADVLVRVVCVVLVVLMLFNGVLLYKLWALEVRTTDELVLRHQQATLPSNFHEHEQIARHAPSEQMSNRDWAKLLDQQHHLHETELERWKAVLSHTIHLMDHMVRVLADLRSSIDGADPSETTGFGPDPERPDVGPATDSGPQNVEVKTET